MGSERHKWTNWEEEAAGEVTCRLAPPLEHMESPVECTAPAVEPRSLKGRLVLLDCASLICTTSHIKKKKKKVLLLT